MYTSNNISNPVNMYSAVINKVTSIKELLQLEKKQLRDKYNYMIMVSIVYFVMSIFFTILSVIFYKHNTTQALYIVGIIWVILFLLYIAVFIPTNLIKLYEKKSLEILENDNANQTYSNVEEFLTNNVNDITKLVKLLGSPSTIMVIANLVNLVADSKLWKDIPKSFEEFIKILNQAQNIAHNNSDLISFIQKYDFKQLNNNLNSIANIINPDVNAIVLDNRTINHNMHNDSKIKLLCDNIQAIQPLCENMDIAYIKELFQNNNTLITLQKLIDIFNILEKLNFNFNNINNLKEFLISLLSTTILFNDNNVILNDGNVYLHEFVSIAAKKVTDSNIQFVQTISNIMPLQYSIFQNLLIFLTSITNMKTTKNSIAEQTLKTSNILINNMNELANIFMYNNGNPPTILNNSINISIENKQYILENSTYTTSYLHDNIFTNNAIINSLQYLNQLQLLYNKLQKLNITNINKCMQNIINIHDIFNDIVIKIAGQLNNSNKINQLEMFANQTYTNNINKYIYILKGLTI